MIKVIVSVPPSTQPVIANAAHTCRNAAAGCISEGRHRTLTQHLRDQQCNDRSSPLFKMTAQVVKLSISVAYTEWPDGSGCRTSDQDDDSTSYIASFEFFAELVY